MLNAPGYFSAIVRLQVISLTNMVHIKHDIHYNHLIKYDALLYEHSSEGLLESLELKFFFYLSIYL